MREARPCAELREVRGWTGECRFGRQSGRGDTTRALEICTGAGLVGEEGENRRTLQTG